MAGWVRAEAERRQKKLGNNTDNASNSRAPLAVELRLKLPTGLTVPRSPSSPVGFYLFPNALRWQRYHDARI